MQLEGSSSSNIMQSNLYESDFYAWTLEQAKLLKAGDFAHLDIAHLVEEIAALGRQERRELENRLGILIGHLLKWDYQPQKRRKSSASCGEADPSKPQPATLPTTGDR